MMRIHPPLAARWLPIAIVLSIAGAPGCAGLASSGGVDSASTEVVMDQSRVEMIFAEQVEAITGPPGAIHTVADGVQLYCISDPVNDRMRLVVPIAQASKLDPELLDVMLRANFHTTLDARYAISEDVVFAVFLHPISSLSPELLRSAMKQVVSLAKTFGTSFSGGGPVYPGVEEASP
ncbi:MAG: hypothetical protein JRG86_18855 [Deltaproteobacteria bacterium]|jgi:hypothetical protein|nr:hypothetical protein [Deltaproteobacteria bacterium]MBW2496676.1 hypothetical protein [Deltaproteobacteria bacterium]